MPVLQSRLVPAGVGPNLPDFNPLLDALVERHWFVAENYLSAELCQALLADLHRLRQARQLTPAGVGRGPGHLLRASIRGDSTQWLDGSTPAQQAYLGLMAQLQVRLNHELFLGLFEYECHYALYPPGAFYQRHLDSFRGRSNRKVTTVLYLNPDWQAGQAGQMCLYHPETLQPLLEVPPRSGTLVCFLSEAMPHEVLPTRADRASIAGWFRCNASLDGVIDPAD